MKKIISLIIVVSILLSAVGSNIVAAGNSTEDMYEEGMEYFEKEDYDHAFSYFQISGEVKGYAPAQNMLGICYRDGLGIETDIAEAEKYFKLSAEQGYAPARENLEELEEAHKEEEREKEYFDLALASVGDYIIFGSYEQDNDLTNGAEPIEWLVLDVEDEKALLISKYALDCQTYNKSLIAVTWEESSLRSWLNGQFLEKAFDDEEQTMIQSVYVSSNTTELQSKNSEKETRDQIFLLSSFEGKRYFKSNSDRRCNPTEYAQAQGSLTDPYTWWWLRSPVEAAYYAEFVNVDGSISPYGNYIDRRNYSVRPALWINLEDYNRAQEEILAENTDEAAGAPDNSIGKSIFFGTYEQDNNLTNGREPIEWLVLNEKYGKALLISKDVLARKQFEASQDSATWDNCSLRAWLNGEFFETAFSPDEKTAILSTTVTAANNPKYGTSSGNNTTDNVFLLSISEAEEYFADSASRLSAVSKAEKRSASDDISWWWLRTAGNSQKNIAVVNSQGAILNSGDSCHKTDGGVRPVIRVRTREILQQKESGEKQFPEKSVQTLVMDKYLINLNHLTVIVKENDLRVTMKGITVEDQYVTNKKGTKIGSIEYGWQVKFNDGQNDYVVQTISRSNYPGANIIKTIDQMEHSFVGNHGLISVTMWHTKNSITWSIDLSKIEEINYDGIKDFYATVIEGNRTSTETLRALSQH